MMVVALEWKTRCFQGTLAVGLKDSFQAGWLER